jgi:thioredoxin reductase
VSGLPKVPDISDRRDAVCVIGAGASGLAAVKNLRDHGFAVDCYERETSVGGAWNFRNDRSPMYASMHAISSRPLTEFPDFPMPDTWPDFLHHSTILSYLERYAEHFDLRSAVWFGTEVIRVEPVDGGRWDVTTHSTGGGAQRTQRYAALVIANGHNWWPKLPEYEGLEGFRGQVMHASAYQDPAQLRGRKVLVIGGGNTGCDIAVEGAQQAARTWHSTRRGYYYAPKYVLGRPADQINDVALRWGLPLRLRQWLYRRTVALTAGDLTRFGVPRPDHRPFESHPVVNSQLVYYLGHGRIAAVPDVARFDRSAVELTDGRRIEPDLVIAATGYLPRFEFLAPQVLDLDPDGRPDLHLHAFARRYPTLAVVGLIQADAGLFPLAHWQSLAVARWMRVRLSDPRRAALVQAKEAKRAVRTWSRRKVVPSSRHWFEVGHTEYLRIIDELLHELEPAS